MDSLAVPPRLRQMRQHRSRVEHIFDTPQAGPSRITTQVDTLDVPQYDVSDAEATPRVTAKPPIATSVNAQAFESSSRLRSIMNMMPSQSAKPIPQRAPSPSQSLDDSDFEAPNMTTYANDASSIAKESLKELFSRVMDSPQKDQMRRRNSIDLSEVEASPRIELVQRERAKNKGKRKSMSDEEADKFAKSSDLVLPDVSYSTSTALAYEKIRQRLSGVVHLADISPLKNTDNASTLSGSVVDMDTDGAADNSGDTASTFRQFAQDTASFALPAEAISTPMRSAQMPSEIQVHSNLMSQDSEMQNAMQGMSTLDADATINKTQRRYPFPDARPSTRPRAESSSHAHGHGAHSKSHTVHNLPLGRRVSMDSISSRSSSISLSDFKDRGVYERERAWNKPGPRSPAHHSEAHRHSSFDSPPHVRSRRSSSASLHGFDDRSSIGGSSVGSRTDFRDRIKEMEDEKNRERERMWNKPRPNLSRSSSSLDFHSPGHNFPARPGSAQSFSTPSRPQSWHSVRGDSRASSPASSVASYGREPQSEPRNPIARERERNWNSNHPSWELQPPPRSVSPLPRSPSASHSHRRLSNVSPSPSGSRINLSSGRNRTVSLGATPEKRASPLVKRNAKYKEQFVAAASSATPPRPGSTDSDGPVYDAAYGSRFGWTFPRHHNPLPPLEFDKSIHGSPHGSPSRPLSSDKPSKIPVRSPGKGGSPAAVPKRPSPPSPHAELQRRLGHRRSAAEIATEIPARTSRIMIEPVDLINAQTEDLVPTDIESGSAESDLESQVTSTPLARPSTIPEEPDHGVEPHAPSSPPPPAMLPMPPMPPAAIPEESEPESEPEEPPPARPQTPPSSLPQRKEHTSPLFGLQTPPRRPQFNTSKLEFQTPSPPHNMPDLPGPPSSDDENEAHNTPSKSRGTSKGNLTMIKTPRPPGAWALTPVLVEKPAVVPRQPIHPAPNFAEVQETPNTHGDATTSKTPAPPGAWQNTPVSDSLRKKGILKVRFDVESNASADTTFDEIPLVGPSSPQAKKGDSISEIFPTLPGSLGSDKNTKSIAQEGKASGKENDAVPGSSGSTRGRSPKSPGVRVLDAFGRETAEEALPTSSSQESATNSASEPEKEKGKEYTLSSSETGRSAVRIVDAMGHEVAESDVSVELPAPRSRSEALRRIRQTVSDLVDDFSDSEDSNAVTLRNEQRLKELYATSQAARAARQGLSESLKKHKDTDAELRAKYGSLRESMQRTKLLPPVRQGTARFSINFLNIWVLWSFLVLQVVLLIYMYWYSTIRAKRIFLTTYYDPFEPALFAHIPRTDALQRATPSPSSVSSPFFVPDALFRSGFKGFLKESWSRVSAAAIEWQVQLWDAWRRDVRTTAWPPT
ncbi:hypothetical protein BDY19DRAFT_1053696 [Irpex rosettiformis]|uniref:Uncharacterized protein n=1 Tax=Irpex rosettiformis TaxID=378272 RepID=A0ACB8UFZ7_9APHY|nr:hypothetical protein BDY19DRAFT_1053696 [Irpex rosettiformis]